MMIELLKNSSLSTAPTVVPNASSSSSANILFLTLSISLIKICTGTSSSFDAHSCTMVTFFLKLSKAS
jgi:hypothetical protein